MYITNLFIFLLIINKLYNILISNKLTFLFIYNQRFLQFGKLRIDQFIIFPDLVEKLFHGGGLFFRNIWKSFNYKKYIKKSKNNIII